MKTLKAIFLSLLMAGLFPLVVMAQGAKSSPQPAKAETKTETKTEAPAPVKHHKKHKKSKKSKKTVTETKKEETKAPAAGK